MSERGSFVTQYIYCEKCFAAASAALLSRDKHLCSQVIDSWQPGATLPIIAGKVGGLAIGEEFIEIEAVRNQLESTLCHPLRVAVLAEGDERIITFTPAARDSEAEL